MTFLIYGFILLFRFLLQVVPSGVATAWLIVRPHKRPVPGLVRMSYSNLNDLGVSIMGCMISLTPGTTTIDIDPERKELLLHLLDITDAYEKVEGIRKEFEKPLQKMYPEATSK